VESGVATRAWTTSHFIPCPAKIMQKQCDDNRGPLPRNSLLQNKAIGSLVSQEEGLGLMSLVLALSC
jgi:hypothetical protein